MDKYPNDFSALLLRHGMGERGHCGCWMNTLGVYLDNAIWTDNVQSVDPAIRDLCIAINDNYHNDIDERTADILKFGLTRPANTLGTSAQTQARVLMFANYLLFEIAVEYFTLMRATSVVEFLESQPPVTADNAGDIAAAIAGFDVRPLYRSIFHDLRCAIAGADSFDAQQAMRRGCTLMKEMAINRLEHQHVTDGHAWRRAFRELTVQRWFVMLDRLIKLGPCEPCPDVPDGGYQAFYDKVGTREQYTAEINRELQRMYQLRREMLGREKEKS